MSFPRYPRYKDSGVEWLKEVPEHWGTTRLRRRARLLTQKTDRREHPVGLENIESWTGRYIATESTFEGDGVEFMAGDVLFGKLRPYLAKALAADSGGEAVGDFMVLRPSADLDSTFLRYILLSREIIDTVDGSTFGSKMPRANWDFVGNLIVPLPEMREQRAVVAFLERETGKLDALINEQQRLIDLLKKKRQAVVSHAVTKGLNPSARTRPSNDPWFGDIPAHWEQLSVRRVVSRIEQGWSPECENRPAELHEWGVVKSGCVNRGVFSETENKALPTGVDPVPELEIRGGDILMSRASGSPELIGSTAVVRTTRAKLLLSDKIFRIHLEPSMTSGFFVAMFNASPLRGQIERSISGAEGLANNLPQAAVYRFSVVVPPVEEQLAISQYVERHVSENEALIGEARRGIALLKERRAVLISAAVTGKIDVRAVDAQAA